MHIQVVYAFRFPVNLSSLCIYIHFINIVLRGFTLSEIKVRSVNESGHFSLRLNACGLYVVRVVIFNSSLLSLLKEIQYI